MLRLDFLSALGASAVGLVVPLPAPSTAAAASPSPTASSSPWDECLANEGLPYDRPLGLKMRVLDGPDFDLMKYRGKAVMINIFATWCPPCIAEMPYLVEASSDFGPKGLAMIALNVREEDNTVRKFRAKYAIDFPIAMDENGTFMNAIERGLTKDSLDSVLPVTLFIDPNGVLWCYRRGGMTRAEVRYRINHLLAASAAALAPQPSPSPFASRQPL